MKAWGIRVQWKRHRNPLSQGGTHLCYRSTIIMHIHHWWIPRYSLIFWYSYTSIWTTQMTIYMYPWCNDVVYIQVDLGLLSTYSSLIDTLVVITVGTEWSLNEGGWLRWQLDWWSSSGLSSLLNQQSSLLLINCLRSIRVSLSLSFCSKITTGDQLAGWCWHHCNNPVLMWLCYTYTCENITLH